MIRSIEEIEKLCNEAKRKARILMPKLLAVAKAAKGLEVYDETTGLTVISGSAVKLIREALKDLETE